jgi:FKBP-type peptidyl-prolyl cis-trans isomerase
MKSLTTFFLLILTAVTFTSCFDSPEEDTHSKEVTQIDNYLASTLTNELTLYDNNTGMRFVFHSFGTKPPPHAGQTVRAFYTGRLFSNGTIFEMGSLDQKLDEISVQGLRYTLASILDGSDVTVYMPSKYGYGAAGTTNVPANSILVYNIELHEVVKTAAETERFSIDTAAIHNYIKNNSIQAIQHPSGIWYKIDVAGSATNPTPYDLVNFDYKLKLMSDGLIKQESSLQNQGVFGLIDGMKVGLPLIGEQAKATFYIPSGLGYGATGTSDIPANANLIFEVTLTDVLR